VTLLTQATDVFAAAETGGRSVVVFLARRQPGTAAIFGPREREAVEAALRELRAEGWRLSVRAMFDPEDAVPAAFDTGFAHGIDIAGAFEAPSLSAALAGTRRLEQAGWSRRFATEWLIGPREWGFVALWEWNDAWCAASPEARREYDAECDVAFAGDIALDVAIAGRHRLDWASSWHHVGLWEVSSPAVVGAAMLGHERAADFKFTTSRHLIGRRRALADLIAE
jgi:hypothetical protein